MKKTAINIIGILLVVIFCGVLYYKSNGLSLPSPTKDGDIIKVTITKCQPESETVTLTQESDVAGAAADQAFMKFENSKKLLGFLSRSFAQGKSFEAEYIFQYDYAGGKTSIVKVNPTYIDYDGQIFVQSEKSDYTTFTSLLDEFYFPAK